MSQSHIFEELDDYLGRAPGRLLDALLAHGVADADADGEVLVAAKDYVLQHLARAEGREPSPDTLRARIKQINEAAKLLGNQSYAGQPPFYLRSRKTSLVLEFDRDLKEAKALKRAGAQAVESAKQDSEIIGQDFVDPMVFRAKELAEAQAKPTYQIFVSHAHEAPEVEAIVKQFCEELERKLVNLPFRYKEQFCITLWLDHFSMRGDAKFVDQTDPECAKSEIAVYLLSDRWYNSVQCQGEAKNFQIRENGPHYLQLQLTGRFSDGDPDALGMPCFPMLWRPGTKNLLEVWEKPLSERDDFLCRFRDEICKILEARAATPGSKSVVEGERQVARALDATRKLFGTPQIDAYEDVVRKGNAERPHVTPKEGDDRAIDAISLLTRWARSQESTNRVYALLGSFGSGKTTASQLFVRHLIDLHREDGEGPAYPVPIYLDLRRLNAVYGRESAPPSVIELIRATLHPDTRNKVDAEKLLAFLRSQPCVVIFDGLDEVGTRIGVERLSALYKTMLELVPASAWNADQQNKGADWKACPTRILFTCRTHFFRDFAEQESILRDRDRFSGIKRVQGFDPVRTIYMAPFTPEQIEAYFRKVLGAQGGHLAFQSIAGLHDLRGLAKKPIMARYIGELAPDLIADSEQGHVINVARVYGHLFRRALERDNDKQPILKFLDRQTLLELLAEKLWRERRPAIGADALEEWFDLRAEQLPGVRTLFQAQLEARGLLHTELRNASLLVRSWDGDFSFVHTSFFEYFLARRLLKRIINFEQEPDCPPVSGETCDFIFDLAEMERSSALLHDALSNPQPPELAGQLAGKLEIAKIRYLARLRKRRDFLSNTDV